MKTKHLFELTLTLMVAFGAIITPAMAQEQLEEKLRWITASDKGPHGNFHFDLFDSRSSKESVWKVYDENRNSLAEEIPINYLLPASVMLAQATTGDVGGGASESSAGEGQYTLAQINEMINNPLGELWILFLQNDLTWYDGDALDFLGEDDKIFNTTTIMPVLSFQLTKNWKYILRPVISIHNWDVPSVSEGSPTFYPGGELPFNVDFDRKWALGDTVFWNAFATNEMAKPPNIYGFGFTAMVPTATNDIFGTNKWSAGPLALAVHIGPVGGFMVGVVGQHWWDFAGPSNESHVNMTNIQYIGYYRLTEDINIGFGPNIVADWTADSDNRWTIPVGFGFNKTVKIGPLPVKMGVEAYYYVERPDNFGPDWGLRFIFAPVVPKPGFSKTPIF